MRCSTALLHSSKLMISTLFFPGETEFFYSVLLISTVSYSKTQREKSSEPDFVCFLAPWSVLCSQFPHICSVLSREEKRLPVVGLRRQAGAQVSSLSVGSIQGGCSKEQEKETSASFGDPAGKRRENRAKKRKEQWLWLGYK